MQIRPTLIFIVTLLFSQSLLQPAFAGFGFGGGDSAKSGLDMNRGYDINTVSTVTGTVIAPPRQSEGKHVIIPVKSGSGTINICVGPVSFWEAKGMTVNVNDELAAKGSIAQGQDGKTYLMAQKLTDKTTGRQMELRDEKGVALWSGRGMNSRGSNRSDGGMRNRGGGMMRGGGGMMRR